MRIKLETIVGLFIIVSISIFLFISFKIGIWRVDTIRYANYIAYFSDVSGLNEKADVTVAGVKVGWLNKLTLVSKNKQVRIDLMIDRNSIIYANAYAVIRQNGLLGTKYIEIIPGDPIYSVLPSGSTLMQPNKPSVSIDELISTVKEIADNVNSVTMSLKDIVGSNDNARSLSCMIENAQLAFRSFDDLAKNTNLILEKNNKNIDSLLQDLSLTLSRIKDSLPDTICNTDRSISEVSNTIKKVGNNLDETIYPIKDVFNKINKGEGVIGTLVSDNELMDDFRDTIETMKNYYSYINRLSISLDAHSENMHGRGNDLDFKDAKGYFNLLLRPADDFYYLLGLTSSYAGEVKRYRIDKLWYDQQKNELVPSTMLLDDWAKLKYAPVKDKYVREYGALTFNMQFAKEINDLCFRLGLFENTFGFGVDYNLPIDSDYKWTTTLEAFRFNEFMTQTLAGRVVADIDMPHLKWYNKIFFNDSLYFLFGFDDFISKFNKNFFLGIGLNFQQDDVKYLATKVSI